MPQGCPPPATGRGAPSTPRSQPQTTPRSESRGSHHGAAKSTPRGSAAGPRRSSHSEGSSRTRSVSEPIPSNITPREKTEDEIWVDNEIQRLRDELMGISEVAKRKARLRELQREYHPDKNPTDMSARVTPLFHYVQRWWEDLEGNFEHCRSASK